MITAAMLTFFFPLFGGGVSLCHYRLKICSTIGVIASWIGVISYSWVMPIHYTIYNIFVSNNLNFAITLAMDQNTIAVMMMSATITVLIHVYSYFYMMHDSRCHIFLGYISLFLGAMQLLLASSSLLLLFFAWELVGVWSYLLIGFWSHKKEAEDASFKAFIINRFADIGFLSGVILMIVYYQVYDYQQLSFQTLSPYYVYFFGCKFSVVSIIASCILLGIMAKSAQFPLHVWLPDSMAAPTPVSALIHSATMVTAGVYLVTKLHVLFDLSPYIQNILLIIGSFTALFASVICVVQYHIKRIIAFSTISQLGFMVAGAGVGAYDYAIFHLITHAFFKALLFLAAGVISLTLHHEQDTRQMGGMNVRLPIVYVCFIVAALSLSGIPPFSGFFSKEMIVHAVSQSSLFIAPYAYRLLLISTWFTAFYITCFGCQVFLRPPSRHVLEHFCPLSKREQWVYHGVLLALSFFSVFLGIMLCSKFILNIEVLLNFFEQKPVYLSLSAICFAILLSLRDVFLSKFFIWRWLYCQFGLEFFIQMVSQSYVLVSKLLGWVDKRVAMIINYLTNLFFVRSLERTNNSYCSTYIRWMIIYFLTILFIHKLCTYLAY